MLVMLQIDMHMNCPWLRVVGFGAAGNQLEIILVAVWGQFLPLSIQITSVHTVFTININMLIIDLGELEVGCIIS